MATIWRTNVDDNGCNLLEADLSTDISDWTKIKKEKKLKSKKFQDKITALLFEAFNSSGLFGHTLNTYAKTEVAANLPRYPNH